MVWCSNIIILSAVAYTCRDYFIAAGALYLFSLFAAQVRTYLMNGVHEATIDMLPSGLVRVKIPTIISWKPGQHIFVRFLTLGLHSLTAHPFTICSIAYDPERTGKASEIVFLIKPRHGITGRLAKVATKSPGCTKKVLLEGPYGGLSETSLAQFDRVLIVAGGSGAGFSLAVVEEALQHPALSNGNLQVVFATRNPAMANWYIDEVETKLSIFNASKQTSVSVHITSHDQPAPRDPAEPDKELPESHVTSPGQNGLSVRGQFRPNLPEVVTNAANGDTGKRVGIFVCGPASMLHDTRNAAAKAQEGVLKGVVEEVFLHTEPFS